MVLFEIGFFYCRAWGFHDVGRHVERMLWSRALGLFEFSPSSSFWCRTGRRRFGERPTQI
jgi:hypothetical protein